MTTTELINPATEQVLRTVELLDTADVDDAVARAKVAQKAWAAHAPAERAAALRSFAAVVDAHVSELAALEVANSGHPIGAAEWEAGHVRDVLHFYAGAPERLSGKQIPVAGGLDVTFNEPIFQGHFPGEPVFPGVLIIEGMAQTAGILVGPMWFADVNMGDPIALKAFAAIIIGGFSSVPGAIVGGILVGLAEMLGAAYISSAYKDGLVFLVMILFLHVLGAVFKIVVHQIPAFQMRFTFLF